MSRPRVHRHNAPHHVWRVVRHPLGVYSRVTLHHTWRPMNTDDAVRSIAEPETSHEMPDLAKVVRTFTVRDGEKPWTVKEVRAIANDLIAEIARLQVELFAVSYTHLTLPTI